MDTEFWEVLVSAAAMFFNLGYIGQVVKTYKTQEVSCLSLFQWVGFCLASLVFVGFYLHLKLWIMSAVSAFGLICCLVMLSMIMMYKDKATC